MAWKALRSAPRTLPDPEKPEGSGEPEEDKTSSDNEADASLASAETAPPRQEIIDRIQPYVAPGRLEEAATVVQSLMISERHSGPLPSAREFGRYDVVLPGAGDRILGMAESEQRHRQELEKKVVWSDAALKGRGQFFAIGGLVAALAVVSLFAYLKAPTQGASLGGAVILGIVALFLGQKWFPPKNGDEDD
jgi:uncharacterized membrane protein